MAELRRFYDPAVQLAAGREGCLSPEESVHAGRVLRLRAGDRARVFDAGGAEFTVEILSVTSRAVAYRALDPVEATIRETIQPTLCFALAKNDKIDWTIQKSTELGLCQFIAFTCRRSVRQPAGARRDEKKLERWRSIALGAVKQSERVRMPRIHPIVSFEEMLSHTMHHAPRLLCDEELRFAAKAPALSAVYDECFRRGEIRPAVLIGPEGGFEREEVALAQRGGWTRVSLGGAALRSETAAIAALAALKVCAGDF